MSTPLSIGRDPPSTMDAWADVEYPELPPADGNLVQHVIARVFATIREERYRVGDRLPSEAQLSQTFGVSRAVMREAFGALSALGVVDVGNGRRPRVSAFNASPLVLTMHHALNTAQITIPQVWEVRHGLERKTAGLAAQWRTREEAHELVEIARRMAECEPGGEQMVALDIRFHRTIAAASHNMLLQQILSSFEPLIRRAVPTAWRTRLTREERDHALGSHRDIASAIADSNVAAVEAAIDSHYDEDITRRLQVLDR